MEPKNLEQVWDACKAAFKFIPNDVINKLSESMPNLMETVQQPKGSQEALCKFNKENQYSLICLLSWVFGLLVDSLLYFQFPTRTHLILSSTLFSSCVLANNLLANQPLFFKSQCSSIILPFRLSFLNPSFTSATSST